MKAIDISENTQYTTLISQIGELLRQGRAKAASAVNSILVQTYWEVGKYIVEFEQKGEEKSVYGSKLLDRLSKDLTLRFGKGFSRSNLIYIRKLYLTFPIGETLSHQLTWGHYFQVLKSDEPLEINFYMKQCEKEKWSVRELKRQMNSMLFHRLALSTDKQGVLALAEKGAEIAKAEDVVKDPYIFEFLGIPENRRYLENELEKLLDGEMENE